MHKKKLPDIKNPTIAAAINGLFKFVNESSAIKKIELIRKNFVISKTQIATEKASVRLWIQNYELTEKEIEQGFIGNFAVITYMQTSEKKFALNAYKEEVDLKFHPNKNRPKQKHPNWKHKILDAALKKRAYKNLADANKALENLFNEFPDICIPGMGKLYIMVYEKTTDGTSPVKKYLLQIKEKTNGEYFIEVATNEKKDKKPEPPKTNHQKAQEYGKFTQMVIMRRSKKRK